MHYMIFPCLVPDLPLDMGNDRAVLCCLLFFSLSKTNLCDLSKSTLGRLSGGILGFADKK